MQRARIRIVAVVSVLGVAAAACSQSYDTTEVRASEDSSASASTTSIVRSQLPTTTVVPVRTRAATDADLTSAFGSLIGLLAADPALAELLAGGLELPDLARLAGIDLGQLELLALSPEQLQQLAIGVLGQPGDVLGQLARGAGGGPIDPAALLALLGGSVDIDGLSSGAVNAIVAALVAAIGDLRINPQLTLQLGELLDGLDPAQWGPINADPANAAFLALLLSAFIGANPVLADQLLQNEMLEPGLREMLTQLRQINATLSDAARAALLETLRQLFPGLVPT